MVPTCVCDPLGLPHNWRCVESELDHTARHQTHPGLLRSRLLSLLRVSYQCMVYKMYVILLPQTLSKLTAINSREREEILCLLFDR
jgi:hypothetical protein